MALVPETIGATAREYALECAYRKYGEVLRFQVSSTEIIVGASDSAMCVVVELAPFEAYSAQADLRQRFEMRLTSRGSEVWEVQEVRGNRHH